MSEEGLNLSQFSYHLPEEKIAKFPLNNRSDSKLLHYHHGFVEHKVFKEIPELIPRDSLLIFNDTKVIPARIVIHKPTGARIEIFLLEPISPSTSHEAVMSASKMCEWKCMIGNAKKWKVQTSITLVAEGFELDAYRSGDDRVIFRWDSDHTFSELLTEIGKIPLPPYIDRETTAVDKPRYQTVYSLHEGAVAAPTAGLHFTEDIIAQLGKKGIQTDFLTLHVSAGTFQPIKSEKVEEHPMHHEQVFISKSTIEKLVNNDTVLCVGTTSLRTLESLYWYGVKLNHNPEAIFNISKLFPYETEPIERRQSLKNVLNYMEVHGLETIGGSTEIMIFPGYDFKICRGLITNFHLPGSTLILLVAALIGDDWRKVYEDALKSDYRFLSYGDSSLLIPKSLN